MGHKRTLTSINILIRVFPLNTHNHKKNPTKIYLSSINIYGINSEIMSIFSALD